MGDIRSVAKDSTKTGGGGTYKFRGIDAVMNAAGPAMRTHGVHVRPHKILSLAYVDVIVGKDKSAMQSVRVMVKYRVTGPDGSHFDGIVPGEAFDSGDKGTAKAMSVAYRTFLLQALTLPTDDPDPDAVAHQRAGSDEHAAMLADLAKWRGEVSAAGRDQAKLEVLWDRMVAEWDTVDWSKDREEILRDAIDASRKPAEAAEEVKSAPPASTGPTDEQAAEYAERFMVDLAQAEETKDARAVRTLIAQAQKDGRPDLKKHAQDVLNDFRKGQ
jgi:hypothetical protein